MVVFNVLRHIASWRVLLAALLVAVPLWATTATPAHACICIAGEDVVGKADLIVVARVEEFRRLDPQPLSPPSGPRAHASEIGVVLAIEEYIKGSGPSTLIATQLAYTEIGPRGQIEAIGWTACDTFNFLGVRYVLFLRLWSDGQYHAGACSGTRTITAETEQSARDYIETIRQALEAPTPLPPPDEFPVVGTGTESVDSVRWAIPAAAAFGALLAAGALLFRRA